MLPRVPLLATASALFLLAGAISPALAANDSPSLTELVGSLSSPDFNVRENATVALTTSDQFDLRALENILRTAEFTDEQRSRLLIAAKNRFCHSPRGALGVQFKQPINLQVDPGGHAVIQTTIPGFPSAAVLKPDDEIVAIEGVAVEGTDGAGSVRPAIISHDPGEAVAITVLRLGRKVSLDVPLGRFSDLRSAQLSDADLSTAWALRSRSLVGKPPVDFIAISLEPQDWRPGSVTLRNHEQALRSDALTRQRAPVVAGGADSSTDDAEIAEGSVIEFRVDGNGANRVVIRQGGRGNGGRAVTNEEVTWRLQISAIEQQRDEAARDREQAVAQLQEEGLNDMQRRALVMKRDQAATRVTILENQLSAARQRLSAIQRNSTQRRAFTP